MDAFGHWGTLNSPWDGDSEFPASDVTYYGGFKQKDVKPQPDAPLAKLGIDKVPPKKVTSNSLVQREMTLKRDRFLLMMVTIGDHHERQAD